MNTSDICEFVSFIPTDGFLKQCTSAMIEKALPYQWKALNNEVHGAPASHAVENFRIAAGEASGTPKGTIFQDSDVAKWIEAAAYSLKLKPDSGLEARIDELIRLIEKSQLPDGYVNTYFIAAAGLEKRWSDLVMGHELYCAGHMIEAAVVYYEATGKKTLLDVMCRYADYIGSVFGKNEGQNPGFDGHPEIELALHRLAKATGRVQYAELANHFVDARGSIPNFHIGRAAMEGMIPKSRWFYADYYLADKPVRSMTEAEGHAVRAMYLYCAMADQYLMTGDEALLTALHSIWKNVTDRRMYITAGLGSQAHGERFTIDYDLPNDTCYTETCASIGLALWAKRMLRISPEGEYADIIERALYNGILSGVSLDGSKYLYVNPLAVYPDVARSRHDHAHVTPERVSWFDCACCPTNLARFILSYNESMCTACKNTLWMHQYGQGYADIRSPGGNIRIAVDTDYPWNGLISIKIESGKPEEVSLRLRIPGWCRSYRLSVNNTIQPQESLVLDKGYVCLNRVWTSGDSVALELDMPVRFILSNPKVRENAGKAAVQRGPVVYCAEEIDNGPDIHSFFVDPSAGAKLVHIPDLPKGTKVIEVQAVREAQNRGGDRLYDEFEESGAMEKATLRLIPYYQWGNRRPGQAMSVWLQTLNAQN